MLEQKNNPYYLSSASLQDGNFIINPKCKVILFRAFCCKIDTLVIPNNIERVDAGAFNQCVRIKKVIIGEKVKNTSKRAFEKGRKITIVGKIGSEAEAFAKEAGLIFEPIE